MIDPAVLSVIGILVTALTLLVGAIYVAMKKAQENTDVRVEVQRVETKREIESAIRDAAETHKDQWTEINLLKEKYHGINTQHLQWCQKHEDAIQKLTDEDKTIESKLLSQGQFFNQRVEELKFIIDQLHTLTKNRKL